MMPQMSPCAQAPGNALNNVAKFTFLSPMADDSKQGDKIICCLPP